MLISCRKAENIETAYYNCNFNFADSSETGVVGITMSVYHTQTGMWIGASGKADLHNNVGMKSCNISRVGSTVKMFTAITILMLMEEGKLNLDVKISSYLQGDMI